MKKKNMEKAPNFAHTDNGLSKKKEENNNNAKQ